MADRAQRDVNVRPFVGCLAVSWNPGEELSAFLDHLEAAELRLRAMVLVDNGSQDLPEGVQTRSGLTVVRNSTNLGFPAAVNQGLDALWRCGCEFAVILNVDVRLPEGFVSSMLDLMKDESVGLAGPALVWAHDPGRVWCLGGAFHHAMGFTRHPGMGRRLGSGRPREVDYLPGCALMVRRKAVESVSGMDPSFFLYFEDLDLGLRARERGWRSVVDPSVVVEHRVSSSTGKVGTNTLSPLKAYFFGRNPWRIIWKGRSRWLPTRILGQFAVRLPYYVFKMMREGPRSVPWYLLGLCHGLAGRFGPPPPALVAAHARRREDALP